MKVLGYFLTLLGGMALAMAGLAYGDLKEFTPAVIAVWAFGVIAGLVGFKLVVPPLKRRVR